MKIDLEKLEHGEIDLSFVDEEFREEAMNQQIAIAFTQKMILVCESFLESLDGLVSLDQQNLFPIVNGFYRELAEFFKTHQINENDSLFQFFSGLNHEFNKLPTNPQAEATLLRIKTAISDLALAMARMKQTLSLSELDKNIHIALKLKPLGKEVVTHFDILLLAKKTHQEIASVILFYSNLSKEAVKKAKSEKLRQFGEGQNSYDKMDSDQDEIKRIKKELKLYVAGEKARKKQAPIPLIRRKSIA